MMKIEKITLISLGITPKNLGLVLGVEIKYLADTLDGNLIPYETSKGWETIKILDFSKSVIEFINYKTQHNIYKRIINDNTYFCMVKNENISSFRTDTGFYHSLEQITIASKYNASKYYYSKKSVFKWLMSKLNNRIYEEGL